MLSRFCRFLPALALVFLMVPGAARAEGLFTVKDIHVDATAASSTEAMNSAIAQGRPRAFQILYRRLTRQQDWNRQPQLDQTQLLRLSRGYDVANERRSTTRYVADISYGFNPEAVARLLRANAIAFARAVSPPVLVIPMAPGVSHGPWAAALANPELRGGLVPFTVAGADETAGLANLDFAAASWSDVAAAAARAQAAQVALVQAVYADGHVSVNIRNLAQGAAPAATTIEVPLMQTVGTTYPAAAEAAVRGLDDMWKARSVIDYSQRGQIVADVRIPDLAGWAGVQSQITGVSNVTGISLVAMNMDYARLAIGYAGNLEQLRGAMGNAGFSLTASRGGQWLLSTVR